MRHLELHTGNLSKKTCQVRLLSTMCENTFAASRKSVEMPSPRVPSLLHPWIDLTVVASCLRCAYDNWQLHLILPRTTHQSCGCEVNNFVILITFYRVRYLPFLQMFSCLEMNNYTCKTVNF